MSRLLARLGAALGVAVLAGGSPFGSAAHAVPWELGGLIGIQMADEELTGSGSESSEFAPTIGPRIDVFPGEHWGIFGDLLFSSLSSSKPTGDATMLHGRGGAELLLPGHSESHQFFFEAGLGWMNVDPDEADSFDRPYWSFGLGRRWSISETTRLKVEVRGDRTMGDNDDAIGSTMHQFEALVGIAWAFGEVEPERDSDGDGVLDDEDRCPDTPAGVAVDDRGCPRDSDRDGVPDDRDQCPNTPSGVAVDERGCPERRDSDGDGVFDDVDQCPNTPKGVAVDERGCPTAKKIFEDEEGQPREALILEGVNFEFNSATLTEESSLTLDRVTESLRAWPEIDIEIAGHTDSVGAADYNMNLSQRRAEAVRDYFLTKEIAANRMVSRGYGEEQPIATNDTDEGRAQNRRVELRKR